MDPITGVGLAASLVQLIGVATKFIGYLNDVVDMRKEHEKLALEVSSLLPLLISLRLKVEASTPMQPWFRSVATLGVKGGLVDQLSEALTALADHLQRGSGIAKVQNALTGPIKKKRVEKLLFIIERMKASIVLAQQNDHV